MQVTEIQGKIRHEVTEIQGLCAEFYFGKVAKCHFSEVNRKLKTSEKVVL